MQIRTFSLNLGTSNEKFETTKHSKTIIKKKKKKKKKNQNSSEKYCFLTLNSYSNLTYK